MTFAEMFCGVGGFRYGLERANSSSYKQVENCNSSQGSAGSQEWSESQLSVGSRECVDSEQRFGNSEGQHESRIEGSTRRFKQEFRCVWANDNDKYACQIYRKHYGEKELVEGDIRDIEADDIPDFDLLTAGFPCQSFSLAGKRRGFEDTRGTLFYEIARVARAKRPRLLLLENVKGLLSNDEGRTFAKILQTLDELGYNVQWMCLNSKHYGVPQNRERIFIIGTRKDTPYRRIFPLIENGVGYDRESLFKNEWLWSVENVIGNERVYEMSQNLAQNIRVLLQGLQERSKKELFPAEMQGLLSQLRQEVQNGESREVEREPEKARQVTKGDLQEIEGIWGIDSQSQGDDDPGTIRRVVQLPTEKVLLLWSSGGEPSISFRCLQQQDIPFDCGQNRLLENILFGEHCSLLLALQPYQGRLFYSVGNGRDWTKICSTEVEGKWQTRTTLSSILEANPADKYFLSDKMVQYIANKTHHLIPVSEVPFEAKEINQ